MVDEGKKTAKKKVLILRVYNLNESARSKNKKCFTERDFQDFALSVLEEFAIVKGKHIIHLQ